MRRPALLLAAVALIVASCGDDTASTTSSSTSTTAAAQQTTTTTSPQSTTTQSSSNGFSVTSDDGRVTLDVPPEALADDPGISITHLPPDQLPEDIAAVEPDAWAYSLEPDGLEFTAPARLTFAIPFEEFAAEGFDDAIPLASIVTTTSDGWELMDDLRVERDGDTVYVSGDTDHFSGAVALPEQVLIEVSYITVTRDRTMQLGVDFLRSDGTELAPPLTDAQSFLDNIPRSSGEPVQVQFEDGIIGLTCPPEIAGTVGSLEIELVLDAMSGSSSQAGLVNAPNVVTLDQEPARITIVDRGVELLCRPTITEDGTIRMDIIVDHPGGAEIIPGEDFKGGLSGMYLDLSGAFPRVRVGLIRDVNSNGVIDPEDVMYPAFPGEVNGEQTSFVIPLFGFGDYFPYLIDAPQRDLETEVLVEDGATIVLGGLLEQGLGRENTAIPFLGDLPYLARVFSEESRQIEDLELVIFLTPDVVERTDR